MNLQTTQPVYEPQTPLNFPKDFIWGAATSAYQIEGAIYQDGRGVSIWDEFAATVGKTYRGESGAIAIDHYNRYKDDVALMKQLGLGAYRFSVAWPRIFPAGTGTVNQKGLDFYNRLVDELLQNNITPIATLFHWDLPSQLEHAGGWLNRDTAKYFADYVETVGRKLGDRVSHWITVNEPWCASYLGYGVGVHAPGHTSTVEAAQSGHILMLAHGLAAQRLRAVTPSASKIGVALNLVPIYTADDSESTRKKAHERDVFFNSWFIDPILHGKYSDDFKEIMGSFPQMQDGDLSVISTPLDFIGINYYSREYVASQEADLTEQKRNAEYTEMGWEIFPEGITAIIERVHREAPNIPIMITENGAAFDDVVESDGFVHDINRINYLAKHIEACYTAIQRTVPLVGYLVWSVFDNYEWAEGYVKRFGIVHVDMQTQQRTIKDSGRWFADFIQNQHNSQP